MYRSTSETKGNENLTCKECNSNVINHIRGALICANCGFIIKRYETNRARKRYITDGGRTRFIKSKKCAECGDSFNPSRTTQKYCGYKCSNTVGNRSRKKEVQLKCRFCKEIFYKRPSDIKLYKSKAKDKWKYCGRECFNKGMASEMTIPRLKVKVWNEFSKYIRERDGWLCFTCGKKGTGRQIHAGHYISRRYNATLFDEMNVHAQCAGCNMFRNGEPHLYIVELIKRYGQDRVDELVSKSKEHKKFTKEELNDLYLKYKELNKLKNG